MIQPKIGAAFATLNHKSNNSCTKKVVTFFANKANDYI